MDRRGLFCRAPRRFAGARGHARACPAAQPNLQRARRGQRPLLAGTGALPTVASGGSGLSASLQRVEQRGAERRRTACWPGARAPRTASPSRPRPCRSGRAARAWTPGWGRSRRAAAAAGRPPGHTCRPWRPPRPCTLGRARVGAPFGGRCSAPELVQRELLCLLWRRGHEPCSRNTPRSVTSAAPGVSARPLATVTPAECRSAAVCAKRLHAERFNNSGWEVAQHKRSLPSPAHAVGAHCRPHRTSRDGPPRGALPPQGGRRRGPGLRGRAQQLLVALQALHGGAADDGRDGAPLRRQQLGQVQQLLVLLARPLGLLDCRVQPLVPARLALLGRLAHEQR